MSPSGTSPARRAIVGALAIAVTFVLAGCVTATSVGADDPTLAPDVAFAGCASLTAPAAAASSAAPGAAGGVLATKLPDLALPCAAGGDPVSLRQLRGPLVINLWASWCGPCRAELPAFQRLVASAAIPVLGIVTQDPKPDAAAWLNHDLGITFPSLTDLDGSLLRALGEKNLPLTVVVRPDGELVIHRAPVLDDESLWALISQQLGQA